MEIILWSILFFIFLIFHKVFKEYIYLRYIPIFLVVLSICGTLIIEYKYEKGVTPNKEDQIFYLSIGESCKEGIYKDKKDFEIFKLFIVERRKNSFLHFSSCIIGRYSFNSIYSHRIINIIVHCIIILLMGRIFLLVYNQLHPVILALVALSPSILVYNLYVLRDLTILMFVVLVIFSFLNICNRRVQSKKIQLYEVLVFIFSILGILFTRVHAIIVPFFFCLNFLIYKKERYFCMFFLVQLLLLFLSSLLFIDIGVFSAGHVFSFLKELSLDIIGVNLLLPDESGWTLNWIGKRILTFDRVFLPFFITTSLFYFIKSKKSSAYLLLFPAFISYKGVYFYFSLVSGIQYGFGFRPMIPLFAIYFILLPMCVQEFFKLKPFRSINWTRDES